jgi:hypothetical protein
MKASTALCTLLVSGNEARLGPDHRTLYFSAADRRIHRTSLAPWLLPRRAR